MEQANTPFSNLSEIIDACSNNEPESLTLEFKEKTDPTTPLLSKEDRKNISKSVSAMANGSGGIIIFGIRTNKKDGTDFASDPIPIKQIKSFQSQFESALFNFVSPECKSWKTEIILSEQDPISGFLVCRVNNSIDRPHMCTATGEHTFYRRTFQGDVPMTPLEIKEQILSIREAELCLIIQPSGGSFSNMSNWLAVKADFVFIIKNVGRTMCKNPFLRVRTDPEMSSHSERDFVNLRHKTTFEPGTIVHIGDSIRCFSLSVNSQILGDQLFQSMKNENPQEACDAIRLIDGNGNLHSKTLYDKTEFSSVNMDILFGSENSSPVFNKFEMSNYFLKCAVFHLAISNLIEQWGGRKAVPWNEEREILYFGEKSQVIEISAFR